MLRWLQLALAAVSFMVGSTTVVFWIRSYRITDTIALYITRWHGDGFIGSRAWGIDSDAGGVAFFRLRRRGMSVEDIAAARQWNREGRELNWFKEKTIGYPYMPSYSGFHLLGFGAYGGAPTTTIFNMEYTDYFIVTPYWFVAICLYALSIVVVRAALRARRRVGCCLVCGYDLRATPEQCPECGTSPLKKNLTSQIQL